MLPIFFLLERYEEAKAYAEKLLAADGLSEGLRRLELDDIALCKFRRGNTLQIGFGIMVCQHHAIHPVQHRLQQCPLIGHLAALTDPG